MANPYNFRIIGGMKRITYDKNYGKTISYNKKGNGRQVFI